MTINTGEFMISFEQFKSKVDEIYTINAPNSLRYGQALMIVLHDVWPEKYHEITGTKYDCFYTLSVAKDTLFKLEKEWNDR